MIVRGLVATIALALAGCAAIDGAPRPVFSAQQEDAEIAPYTGADAIARYETCADKMACRNLIIDARVRAVDLAFYRYQRKTHRQEGRAAIGADAGAMALDSLAAVTGTGPLAAGAELLTGGRKAYTSRILATSEALLLDEAMARRRAVLLRIRQGEQLPVTGYSLFQALDDISAYEHASSISEAAAALAAETGAESRATQAKLDGLRRGDTQAPATTAAPR